MVFLLKSDSEKSGIEILKEHMPEITSAKTLSIIVGSTGIVLVLVHLLNMIDWWAPLLVAIVIYMLAYWTMSRISRNAEKIRENYRNKYEDRAYTKFFYYYLIPVIPPNTMTMILIIMVENNTFIPMLYPAYQNNILYQTIIPWQIAFPLAILLIGLYPLMGRDAVNGGFTLDTELFLYIIYPEKAKKFQDAAFKYIRHPHYAEGVYMCFGLALLSQNIIALILAILATICYYFVARSEDKELIRRYGLTFEKYVKSTPSFLPKVKDWGAFLRLIVTGK